MNSLKIAFAYNASNDESKEYYEKIIATGRKLGYDIYPVVVTPDARAPHLTFAELHHKFRDKIIEEVSSADVFWLFDGANFHPSWLQLLPKQQLKIYGCHDDPESSENLSLSIAPYFDAVITGNIGIIPFYQGHTRRETFWLPLFQSLNAPRLTEENILGKNRHIDLVFIGTRNTSSKRSRLDYLQQVFPDAVFRGHGWPKGRVDNIQDIYLQSKIGINIHNSVGPVNTRLYELASHGVMQICDNKCRLGHIFQLDKEIIGYDYIDEAVDKIKYYLDKEHEQERFEIAWNGYQRYLSDYTPEKIWQKAIKIVDNLYIQKQHKLLIEPLQYKYSPRIYSLLRNAASTSKKIFKEAKHILKRQGKQDAVFFDTPLSYQKKKRPPLLLRDEVGPEYASIADSIKKECGFTEYPNMVALNYAITPLLGNAQKILEIGSGRGVFAYEAAQDPTRHICALELDPIREWAKKNRSLPNITYSNEWLENIHEKFDLIVAMDVIEHILNYKNILKEAVRLAPRAIFTTPNRRRIEPAPLIPSYYQHVQEWSAESFYYTLSQYFNKVYLLSMPDPYLPITIPIDINSTMSPIIAICEN